MSAAAFQFDEATHTYSQDGVIVPSVSQVLKLAGLSDYSHIDPVVLARKAAIGTEVHRATEMIDRGVRPEELELDEAVQPYVEAYLQFLAEEKYEPGSIEYQFVFTQCDMKFGGTIDRHCELNERETLLDIKCSASVNDACWPIQLAAYDVVEPGRNRVILHLRPALKTKKYRIIEYNDPKYDAVWLAALTMAYYKLEHKLGEE